MATKNVKTTGTGGPGRFCTREEAKTGSRVRRRREDKVTASGYVDCGCRDCFDVAVGVPGDLCSECKEAGCDTESECRRTDAYGGED